MLKVDPDDRPAPQKDHTSLWQRIVILIVVVTVGWVIVYYEWKKWTYKAPPGESTYTEVYKRLGIAPLSTRVENQRIIQSRLDQLAREPCYRDGVLGLSDALVAAGYPRDSATILLTFARNCGGPALELLERAYMSFKQVNDFAAALSVAEDLVISDPASATFRNHRAEAYENLKNFSRALEDYINVVQLLGDPAKVAGRPFYNISLMYVAMGQYCNAITPIETYLSFDPINRKSTQASRLIEEYAAKGNCYANHSNGTARVRIVKSGGVHTLSVIVNGIAGNFILDTGAAYVAITPDFAKKAGIVGEGAILTLKTVSGAVTARLNHGNTIAVGAAEARGVPVAVLMGDADPFGARLDGLLGMSFLARFKVTVSQGGLELAAIPLR